MLPNLAEKLLCVEPCQDRTKRQRETRGYHLIGSECETL